MPITEIRDIVGYNNLQLVNKIKKMNSKANELSNEEKEILEAMKKEAWKRGIDNIT